MPRNISFALTTQQFIDGTKDVTRRLGWLTLKAGDILMAVEQGQGLKKGQKVRELGLIRVVDARREALDIMIGTAYGSKEAAREGFPHFNGRQFVDFFIKANQCNVSEPITRIEFVKLEREINR